MKWGNIHPGNRVRADYGWFSDTKDWYFNLPQVLTCGRFMRKTSKAQAQPATGKRSRDAACFVSYGLYTRSAEGKHCPTGFLLFVILLTKIILAAA